MVVTLSPITAETATWCCLAPRHGWPRTTVATRVVTVQADAMTPSATSATVCDECSEMLCEWLAVAGIVVAR